MSEALETAIRDLLIGAKDYQKVAESLIKRMKTESPSRQERIVFIQFLIASGFTNEALELFQTWFKEKKRIPLYAFCFLLHRAGFKPGQEFLSKMMLATEQLKSENNLTHFLAWEALDSRFVEMKQASVHAWQQAAIERKKNLFDKLEYYRLNNMIDEEQKLLSELALLYPEDESIKENKQSFQERWARAIIAKKAISKFDETLDWTEPSFSPADELFIKILIGEMKEIATRKSEWAYDFALGLSFLDLHEGARQLLEMAKPSLAVDWFYVDTLLKCRRFAEGLDALATIENKYADDPETIFGVTYHRALALEGLGQKPAALELIRSLVDIRPGYRSAHSLLRKWGG